MHQMSRFVGTRGVVVGMLAAMLCTGVAVSEEMPIEAPWYMSAGFGLIQFEGDEALEDGYLITARLGYDYSEWWTFEGAFSYAPKLDENFRYDYTLGEDVSRLEEATGDDSIDDTFAIGLSLDALFHFTRWDRLDPYLSVGVGAVMYGEEIDGDSTDLMVRGGGGVFYHFNDEWAIRIDGRAFFAGNDTEANAVIDAGIIWTWGAGIAPNIIATDGPVDSDGDRLSDIREGEIGTNPYDPDTDKDGLSDGEEVLDYKTDPFEPDTDWDGLKDGPEVHKHKTDPLDSDTDDGGVSDGHEVLDDGTDPLNGADDLQLFRLNIRFDYNESIIKQEYFSELDIIGKVLTRHEGSSAVVEGHADRKKLSNPKYNMDLSQRRAQAVVDYLVTRCGIDASRLRAVGFGFNRPQAPNDPEVGNPVNRRVDVYIRGAKEGDEGSVLGDVVVSPPAENK